MWCAKQVKNEQVIKDPNVSVFNVHRSYILEKRNVDKVWRDAAGAIDHAESAGPLVADSTPLVCDYVAPTAQLVCDG